MPFEKGVSGNPKGRPKRGAALTDILRVKLDMKGDDGIRHREAIANCLLALARSGDLDAIKYIYDRCDGKPAQAIQHSGDEGGPLVFTLRLANDDRDETETSEG
jgi:hypothetical protein